MSQPEKELILQTARLVPSSKRLQPLAGSALAYFNEPAKKLGSLMIIVEILGPSKKTEEIIDLIVHTAEKDCSKDTELIDPEARFENAIRSINTKLIQYKDLKINAVIALFVRGSLLLTSAGAAEAYLCRGQRNTNITTGLAEQNNNAFSSVARGQLQVGDQLAIVTPALLHQISQTELKSIVNNMTPSSAVAKIAQLIEKQTNTNRAAALIGTVTTPDLLAMNIRNSEPSEITIAHSMDLPNLPPSLTKASQSLVGALKNFWQALHHHAAPNTIKVAKASIQAMDKIKHPWSKRLAITSTLLLTLAALWGMFSLAQSSNLVTLEKKYVSAYELFKSANTKLQSQDKAGATNDLNSAAKILEDLSKTSNRNSLEKRLQRSNRPADDPVSIKGLSELILGSLDEINNTTRIVGSPIYNFAGSKVNPSPKFIELLGDKIVSVNSAGAPTINDLSGKVVTSKEAASEMGKIVGITPNASEDGLFIMTDKPSLWLYKMADNSLAQQDVSLGSLVKGPSIASYNGNVYVLTESGVFKHIPTLAGFSTPTSLIKFSDSSVSTIAIDGNIYIGGGSNKVERYLAGSLTHKAKDLPNGFSKPSQIRPVGDSIILVLSDNGSRIAVLELTNKDLLYKKQIALKDNATINSFIYDNGSIYALSEGKLLKAQLKL